ncbi:hypothetical protein GCM10007886_43450 [Methylobacterium gregans]|nr:hypothetical protein GCM10007886_43450 [Methylobacterium gregans]
MGAGESPRARARVVRACAEMRGQDRGRTSPDPARIRHDLRHGGGGRGDHHEVGRLGEVRDLGDAGVARHARVARVDRKDAAREARRPQVLQHGPPERALALARTHQGDGARVQQRVEPIGAQGGRSRPRAGARFPCQAELRRQRGLGLVFTSFLSPDL